MFFWEVTSLASLAFVVIVNCDYCFYINTKGKTFQLLNTSLTFSTPFLSLLIDLLIFFVCLFCWMCIADHTKPHNKFKNQIFLCHILLTCIQNLIIHSCTKGSFSGSCLTFRKLVNLMGTNWILYELLIFILYKVCNMISTFWRLSTTFHWPFKIFRPYFVLYLWESGWI